MANNKTSDKIKTTSTTISLSFISILGIDFLSSFIMGKILFSNGIISQVELWIPTPSNKQGLNIFPSIYYINHKNLFKLDAIIPETSIQSSKN